MNYRLACLQFELGLCHYLEYVMGIIFRFLMNSDVFSSCM